MANAVYEIIGTSGLFYIGKVEDLEHKIIKSRLPQQTAESITPIKVSECIILDCKRWETLCGIKIDSEPEEILKRYGKIKKGKEDYFILPNSVEAYRRLSKYE